LQRFDGGGNIFQHSKKFTVKNLIKRVIKLILK